MKIAVIDDLRKAMLSGIFMHLVFYKIKHQIPLIPLYGDKQN